MHRLICVFFDRIWRKEVLSWRVSYNDLYTPATSHNSILVSVHNLTIDTVQNDYPVMHQSFVTTASVGPENSGDFDFWTFLFEKPGYPVHVYAQHCKDIFMLKVLPKPLLKSWQVKVKLFQLLWAWNQKPCSSVALWGRCWTQNTTL